MSVRGHADALSAEQCGHCVKDKQWGNIMNFDMNTSWSRAVELLQSNFQLLLSVAGVFLLLPTLAFYMLIPDMQMLTDPTIDQDILAEKMLEMAGPLMAVALVSTVFQFAGNAAMVALMGDARPTVGQEIGAGFKSVLSLFGVLLIFVVLIMIGGVAIMVPFVLLVALVQPASTALAASAPLPILVFMIWLLARMSMTMPVNVLGAVGNQVTDITQSFALTKPKQWPIAGFWVLIYVIMTIAGFLFNGAIAVIAAIAGSGTIVTAITGLSNGLTGAITGAIGCAVAVAMYMQLSGPSQSAIEETFE